MNWLCILLCGGVLWTLLEYLLHRFVFHEKVLGKLAAQEHIEHHARVSWFAPMSHKLLAAMPILGVVLWGSTKAMGFEVGLGLTVSTFVSWAVYEWLHRALHVRAPRSAYGRWARKHHLFHHFGRPNANYGVTTPLWDYVFGTLERPETVRIPERHAAKFPWLGAGTHPGYEIF